MVLHSIAYQNNSFHEKLYNRFCKWYDSGTLSFNFKAPNSETVYDNLSIDSTLIKFHQHSAGTKRGL